MRMHHLHKVQVILSKSSTQIEEEVEDVVQAEVEVVTVAIKAKVNTNSSKMIHRDQTHMEEDNIEAGGVKEVAGTSQEIMQEMKVQNVGIVEGQVTLNMTVHQGVKMIEDNKTIMHQLTGTQMIQRGCLSCSTCQILCLQMYQCVVTMYGMGIHVL